MKFEFHRISKFNYQLFFDDDMDNGHHKWLASFNSLNSLLDYYVYCHNLSNDRVVLTGTMMEDDESKYFNNMVMEWNIIC